MTDQCEGQLGTDTRSEHKAFRNALIRQEYQLLGCLAVAGLLPLLAWVILGTPSAIGDYSHTTLMVFLSVILAHLFVQQLTRYPGESALSTTLPAVSAAFGLVVLVIALTHAPYSRGLLIAGYTLCVLWYAGIVAAKRSYLRPRLAVVPQGNAASFSHLGGADWHRLSAPSFEIVKKVDGVVADLDADLNEEWRAFLTTCAVTGIPVYDSTRLNELTTGQVDLEHMSDIGFEALLPHRSYLMVKTVADYVFAVLVLPFALIVITLAVIAVRLESKGEAIFVQKRVGYRGRIFNCYKIRSMRVNQPGDAPHFTSDGDPRITRVGRLIRKYRIDELPQIFNILKGEMSWIGPRPEAVPLSQTYERGVPFYHFRHSVKPGISGWAAIHQGNVAELDAATTKLRYDFFYIKNISLPLDVYIACKTVWILLTGFGAK
jgi:lipopolysaccharide/colanic/teichoic acid biosynthesis glycosyltransferase